MSPSVIATKYIRNLYRLLYPDPVPEDTARDGMAPVLLVGRMSVPPEIEPQFNQAYNSDRLPLCYKVPGYIRGRRFEAIMGEPKYITVHEMQSLSVPESPEWETWRTSVTPVWNETVQPKMTHVSGSPGIYTRAFPS